MEVRKGNILTLKDYTPDPERELFEILFNASNCKVERIVSAGQVTQMDHWYDQDQDEWVVLLQGHAVLEFLDASFYELKKGDFIFIPSHFRHRVVYTSEEPACIWLAIHGDISL